MAAETELERMVVRLVGDAQQYVKALEQAKAETKAAAAAIEQDGKKVEQVFDQLAASAKKWIASIGASALLKQAFGNFSEAESIAIKLNATLEANGREVESLTKDYKAFAEQMEAVSTLEDDQVLNLLKMAESFDTTGRAAKNAVKQSAALAAGLGGEAESYIRITAAIAKGDIELAQHMSRLIPQLRGIKDEAEFTAKFFNLVAAGEKAMAAEAQTVSGQLKQLKRDFGNLLEDLGAIVAQIIGPAIQALKSLVATFRESSPVVKDLSVALLGLTAAAAFGWTAGAIVAIIGVANAVRNLDADVQALKQAGEEAASLQTKITGRVTTRTGAIFEEAGKKPETERKDFLGQELLRAEKELEGYNFRIADTKRQVEELAPSILSAYQSGREVWNQTKEQLKEEIQLRDAMAARVDLLRGKFNEFAQGGVSKKMQEDIDELTKKLEDQAVVFGLAEHWAGIYKLQVESGGKANLDAAIAAAEIKDWLDAQAKAYDEAQEAAKKLASETANLAEELEAQIATFGMGEEAAKLYKLQLQGVDEATIGHLSGLAEQKKALEDSKKAWEKLVQEGERVTESVLDKDPLSKYGRELGKLEELLDAELITWETFALGVKQANEELKKAQDQTAKVSKELQKLETSALGSADFFSKLAAYQEGTGASARRERDRTKAAEELAEAKRQRDIEAPFEKERAEILGTVRGLGQGTRLPFEGEPGMFRPPGATEPTFRPPASARRHEPEMGTFKPPPATIATFRPGADKEGEVEDEQLEVMQDMRNILQKQADRPVIQVEFAGLE